MDFNFSKRHWPKSISHKTVWIYFQDVLSYAITTVKNHTNQPLLKYTLKLFSILMVKFAYGNIIELIGVWIQCDSCKRHVHLDISE